ncbi:hypothetical protein E3E35_09925 [Thermococcus sp. GR7]|uniref:hypothetical protein n=1 Tax=unclassified Thermococcus TaxID=2627626 RepID=UPI0014314D0E|nr:MULTISPECIES: hypothetical protein [unclassified Thermococcus]NJE41919.1 hypothetical protein [Thermococcus sp. GR6]NJE47705.1 hypothetical protein [Thermococcus sp. GR7]NJE79114.1 hypothetical protein [Thermococcus sp. GR4]NJF22531.1 hypothetical protein [Thermococcus sp. GR5]
MIVLFLWTKYLLDDMVALQKAVIVALYVVPIVLWVKIAFPIYTSISAEYSTMGRTGQEGF